MGDALALWGAVDPCSIAHLMRKHQIPPAEVVAELQLLPAEAVAVTRVAMKGGRLHLEDVTAILQTLPFAFVDFAKQFRVNIADVMSLIRHFEVPLEEIVDIMLSGLNWERALEFVNGAVARFPLCPAVTPALPCPGPCPRPRPRPRPHRSQTFAERRGWSGEGGGSVRLCWALL